MGPAPLVVTMADLGLTTFLCRPHFVQSAWRHRGSTEEVGSNILCMCRSQLCKKQDDSKKHSHPCHKHAEPSYPWF